MKSTTKITYIKFFLFFMIPLILVSCFPKRKMKYISEGKEDKVSIDYPKIRERIKIRPADKLYIEILSLDEKTNQLFSEDSKYYSELDMKLNSYEVSDSGYIDFPFVGKIHVGGYTLSEAKRKLEEEISLYLPNTSVKLKYAGNYITVLGEVRDPGNHLFFKERINVFEALGYAGGIKEYGNKKEIMVIREENNETNYHTIDLTSRLVSQSPYYRLSPDDIIIVKPLNAKFQTLKNYQLESLLLSSITTIITVLYYFTN